MRRLLGVLLACAPTAACSSGSTTVASSPPGTLAPAVVTIRAAGLDPQVLHFAAEERVTFVNNDTWAHEVRSDPHAAHTECPTLNVGPIPPGESRQAGRIDFGPGCGYHLEEDPANRVFQGFVLAH